MRATHLILVFLTLMTVVVTASRVRMEASVASTTRSRWARTKRASLTDELELTIAVTQTNLAELEATLLRVSDPRHEHYGAYLSRDEVHELVAPRKESVVACLEWLESVGVDLDQVHHSPNSDFLTVDVTVEQAEALLQAEYHWYAHRSQPERRVLRVHHEQGYSVPAHLHAHVDFVTPTLRFPAPIQPRIHAAGHHTLGSQPDALFNVPEALRALYQVPESKKNMSPQNSQAVASFLEQYYSPSDLQEFYKLFDNSSVGLTVKDVGVNNPNSPGMEAELDVQYLSSMGNHVPTLVYYTPGRNPNNNQNEPFLSWLKGVAEEQSPPHLFSVSYGEDEKSAGYDYALRCSVEFQKMGSRGISLLFAAGDSGAGGNCTSYKERDDPNFPVSSPWVTGVGGLVGGTAGQTPTGEAVDMIGGGGFSDFWARPAYQEDAVKAFLANSTALPPAGYFNHTGRGYPDIAAQSEMFTIVYDGLPLPGVGGTSCATPTAAGIFALLNDIRLQMGKPVLGFLNPFIYQTMADPANKNAFNDAVIGNNQGCDEGYGFPARPGWDAASGWGSLNYRLLSAIVSKLP